MPAELAEDIFCIIFIDQEIPQHDIIRRTMAFKAAEKFLLVPEGNLGIRDKYRWDKGMGGGAFFAPDTLYNEEHEG